MSKKLEIKNKDFVNIGVGSCFDLANRPNNILESVVKENFDLFVWLGDAVYLDESEMLFSWSKLRYINVESTLEEKYRVFNITYHDPLYNKLKSQVPIIGTWDDHDMGLDNSGKEYKNKERGKELFLNFLDEPLYTTRRTLEHEGVYEDYFVTTPTLTIHLILLDIRYNLVPKKDVLGE